MSFVEENEPEIQLGLPEGLYLDERPPYDESRYFSIDSLLVGRMVSDISVCRVSIDGLVWIDYETPEETYEAIHEDEKARKLLLNQLKYIREAITARDELVKKRRERSSRQQSVDIVE